MKKEAWKIVVLGEGRVGKTSLIHRLCFNKFDEHEGKTSNATSFDKSLQLGITEQAKLVVWDTAGQERFYALNRSYYQGAKGALLVLDITDSASFAKIKTWSQELLYSCPGIPIVIAGNKVDLAENRIVAIADSEE
jgi:small GTP-binding protein